MVLSSLGFELGTRTLGCGIQRFKNEDTLEKEFSLFIEKKFFFTSTSKLYGKRFLLLPFYFYSTKSNYNYSINDSGIWNALLWATEQNAIKIVMATSVQSLLEVGFPFLIIHSLVLSYCEIAMKLYHFGFEGGW